MPSVFLRGQAGTELSLQKKRVGFDVPKGVMMSQSDPLHEESEATDPFGCVEMNGFPKGKCIR